MARKNTTIEDDIASAVGITDEETGGDTDEVVVDPGEETAEKVEEVHTDDGDGTQSTKSEAGTSTDSKQGKGTSGPQPLRDRAGNIIAEGGRERRFYEAAQIARQERDAIQAKLATVEAKVQAFEQANSIGTQLKLSPEETITGMKIMAAYKANPAETIKYLLTEAQSQGHNVQDVLGNGFDASVVKNMVNEALKPILQDREEKQKYRDVEERAVSEYNAFTQRYPDVKVHESSIARLLESDPQLTPDAAYYKLRSFYLEKGLDWTKSLETIASEMEKSKTTQSASDTRSPGLPGKGTNSGTATTAKTAFADVDTSTDDIVKSAMREAGIQIQ